MTTTTLFVDAAFAGNQAQLSAAKVAGANGCGFYLPNQPTATNDPLNTWTPQQVADARVVFGKNLVGIWVPDPSLPGNPITEAGQAYQSALSCGITPTLSGLYDGNHLTTSGQITGPVWLPQPGAKPATVGSQSAIQWGQSTVDGWSVDWDIAATDFPWDTVIMVDFEFNTIAGQFGINWYQAFQKEITTLTHIPVTPVPPAPLPPAPAPVVPSVGGVPVTFTTSFDGNQQVFWVDGFGHLLHAYFLKTSNKWSPIEPIGIGWAPNSSLTWYQYNGTYQVWGKRSDGLPIQAYWSGKEWVVQPLS